MTNANNNIQAIIRENFNRAKRILTDKSKAESMIFDALNEISILVENKIEFISYDEVDSDGDTIKYVHVKNKKSEYIEHLITYYFHAEKIFPVVMSYQNIINSSCKDLAEVQIFLERLMSNESFMIKIIRVSDDKSPSDEEIPF